MTLVLDTDLLARTARELLRHDLALRAEAPPEAPDTGESSALTAAGLDALDARVRRTADDTHDLADALDTFLVRASGTDGQVAAMLDVLFAGTLR